MVLAYKDGYYQLKARRFVSIRSGGGSFNVIDHFGSHSCIGGWVAELESSDGAYVCADQGDGNFVVYRRDNMTPVWDRWSYEASHGKPHVSNPTPKPEPPPNPSPPTISPIPILGLTDRPTKILNGCNPAGMAYWRNINYHAGRDSFLAALSIYDQLHVLTIRKSDLAVIDIKSLGINHTGEDIYFSATRHDILYVPLDGILIAVNVFTGDRKVIWESPGHKLWQIHSSYDEQVHSATLQSNNYEFIGWAVLRNDIQKEFPLNGDPDECQIDKSGKWLVTKYDNDNDIINLMTGEVQTLHNQTGAAGHSDCGFECLLGEDDYYPEPGALVLWDFKDLQHSRTLIDAGTVWNMGYVSFTNAKPGNQRSQKCLVSRPEGIYLVNLDGGERFITANNSQSDQYEYRVKANLCPLGEYALWTAYVDNSLNAYVIRAN